MRLRQEGKQRPSLFNEGLVSRQGQCSDPLQGPAQLVRRGRRQCQPDTVRCVPGVNGESRARRHGDPLP